MKDYSSDEEKSLVVAGEEKEERRIVVPSETGSDEVYPLPPSIKSRSLIWSALSIVLAALALILCRFYYVGIVFSLVAVGMALISRKNLGFFEKYSILGIIFGIIGFIINIFMMIADLVGLF